MSEIQAILHSCLELPAVRRVALLRWGLHPIILEREVETPRRGPKQPVSTEMIWQNSLNILAEGGNMISRATDGLVIAQMIAPGAALLVELLDIAALGVVCVKLDGATSRLRSMITA